MIKRSEAETAWLQVYTSTARQRLVLVAELVERQLFLQL